MLEDLKHLDAFLSDIEKLKEAREILIQIWMELSPYNNGLSNEVNSRLRAYFHFDDSE